jgi:hypothetical protein
VRTIEVREEETRAGEVRAFEVRAIEVSFRHGRAFEVRAVEVRAGTARLDAAAPGRGWVTRVRTSRTCASSIPGQ